MDKSHAVTLEWMGEHVETLDDLFPASPRAVCVGINPAPVSVAAGHYYQGRQGQRFFSRLRQAGLLPDEINGFEDDAAVALGIGFTDLVKRPTGRAGEVTAAEMKHGVEILERKLSDLGSPTLIFPFKKTAQTLVGPFDGNGWLPSQRFADCELFVMPGPYEAKISAERTIATLADRIRP